MRLLSFHQFTILPLVLFLVLTLEVKSQIEQLTDADIPCEKVLALDGETGVGTNYSYDDFQSLILFNLNSGAIISTIDGVVQTDFSFDGNHYFLLSESSFPTSGRLYTFENGQLSASNSEEDLLEIYVNPELNAPVGITSTGFTIISDGDVGPEVVLGEPLLNLSIHGDGYMAVCRSGFHFINADFTVEEEYSFPEGYVSFEGASEDQVLLLTPENVDSLRPLWLYNTISQDLSAVVNSTGSEVQILPFITPKTIHEGHFFLAGTGHDIQAEYINTFTTKAGFINASTGVYTPAGSGPGLYYFALRPEVVNTTNGPVAFGRMGIEGVEPYAISGQKIEVVKDIYKGFGASLDFVMTSSYFGHPGGTPMLLEFAQRAGVVYFAARSAYLGLQVWRTDGTRQGTYAITEENIHNKGFQEIHLSHDDGKVLLTTFDRDNVRRLFQVSENPAAVKSELDESRNWEVSYAVNPLIQGGSRFFENHHPGVYLAADGSSVLALNRTDIWVDHLSFNQYWTFSRNKIQGSYANTAVQIIESDGSLRSSTLIRARRDQQRTIGRSHSTGHVFLAVSHLPQNTFIDRIPLPETREGHYLIELDDFGITQKATFLNTGGKDRLRIDQIKVTEEGIYVLGMADRNFNLDNAYANTIAPGFLRAVVLKFNLDHELEWIADSGLDQAIFGSGLQCLVVGDESLYISSGGTSYSVSSSCAHHVWPYQISRLNKATGEREWRVLIEANDVTRITSLELVGDDFLWVAGYTRGDLSLGNRHLEIESNYLSCSYNDFLLGMKAVSGNAVFFEHTDASRPKFIQDIRFHEDHLYTLSLVYEEELFLPPISQWDGRWTMQIDKITSGGLKVDSLSWRTSIYRTSLGDRLRQHKFSFDFHPDGGIVLSGQEITNGTIDGFSSPSSDAGRSYLNSWLMQRRDIDELINSRLAEVAGSGREFRIYPNPVSGSEFIIQIPREDLGRYERLVLTDIQGRPCMSQNIKGMFETEFIALTGDLANGVYLVQLTGSLQSKSQKLLLRR